MTQDVSPELVELLRELLEGGSLSTRQDRLWAAMRPLVAELPAPVDPDLLLAREVVANDPPYQIPAVQFRNGHRDGDAAVRYALAAIRRVRAEGSDKA